MRPIALLSNLSSSGSTLCINKKDFRGLYFYEKKKTKEIEITNHFSNYGCSWYCKEDMIRGLYERNES